MTEDQKKHPKSAILGVAPIQYIPDSKELYDFINEEVDRLNKKRSKSRNQWLNDQLTRVMEEAKAEATQE